MSAKHDDQEIAGANAIAWQDDNDRFYDLLSVLSNKDTFRIFSIASQGTVWSKATHEKYGFSRSRYYLRLKQLIDLSLVMKDKKERVYRHTLLGSIIYQNQVSTLGPIAKRNNILEIMNKMTLKNWSPTNDSLNLAISDYGKEALAEVETALGLSNLRPIRLFRTFQEYDHHIAMCASKAKSELYLATRNLDLKTIESVLSTAQRGGRINMAYSHWKVFGLLNNGNNKKRIVNEPVYWRDLLTSRKKLLSSATQELQANPNVLIHRVKIPYGFLVVDSLEVAFEMVDPEDPQSFFVGVGLQNSALATRLISFYQKEIAKRSSKTKRDMK